VHQLIPDTVSFISRRNNVKWSFVICSVYLKKFPVVAVGVNRETSGTCEAYEEDLELDGEDKT
jgi:hypothetical protein